MLGGVVSRHFHSAIRAITGRSRDMIGIAAHTITDNLGINFSTASLSVLKFLQYQRTGSLAHNKTTAILIPRTRSLLRIIIKIRGNRLHTSKSGQPQYINCRFCTAGQHQISVAPSNHRRGVANGMSTG